MITTRLSKWARQWTYSKRYWRLSEQKTDDASTSHVASVDVFVIISNIVKFIPWIPASPTVAFSNVTFPKSAKGINEFVAVSTVNLSTTHSAVSRHKVASETFA